MRNANQASVMRTMMAITAASAIWFLTGPQTNAGDWAGELQAGAGYWAGDATYSIGGESWTPEHGTAHYPDKLSELSFPLDVPYGSLMGSLKWKGRFEVYGSAMANLSDPSTKATDADWGYFTSSSDHTLDVYSESDADLTAIAADVGLRYWIRTAIPTNPVMWSVGIGPSLLYEHLEWSVSNTEQWYPSHPELDHHYSTPDEVVLTYQSDIVMPYLNANANIKVRQISGHLEIGIGYVAVQDEDDHMLRGKRSTGDMSGVGIKGSAEIQYNFTQHLFALAKLTALSIQATGTQTQEGYGTDLAGFYGKIDEDYSLTSVNGSVGIGTTF